MDIQRYPSVLEEADGIPISEAAWLDMRWSAGMPPLPAAEGLRSHPDWDRCACSCGCRTYTPNVICRWCSVAGVHEPEDAL